MKRVLSIAMAMACAVSAAQAQSFVYPRGYMWSSHIPTGWTGVSDPMLKPMVHVPITDRIQYDDNPGYFDPWDMSLTPETGAYMAGRFAAKRVVTLGLQAGDVTILVKGFGHDADPATPFSYNFFRPSDRIHSTTYEATAGNFPFPSGDPGEGGTARTYRHPFLANTGFTIVGGVAGHDPSAVPELKAWMIDFCDGYAQEQADQGAASPAVIIPDPDKFYFDTEVFLTPIQHRNCVHILKMIADQYGIWSQWPVPGCGSNTLKDLYDLRVADGVYNWPADDLSVPLSPVAGITLTGGIDDSVVANNSINIDFMIWWAEICTRALGEVMRFSAYDVIHAKWGAIDPYTGDYAVKCGNYREFQADGLDTIYGTSTVDRVSWFQDRPGNNTLSFPRDYDATMTPSVPHEELPRFAMDKNLGNFLLRGSQFATDKRRYLGFPWYATGQVDSPVLYPGKNSEHTSHRQQKDYYRLGNPLTSTPFEAARLMARRDVETAINSNLGENEFRLVPWMMMSGTSGAASIDPDVFLDFRQFRELQQMVRAKNVGELLFWTNVTNTSDTDLAWAETAEWLPRVYATRVLTYVRQTGPITIPPPLVDVERLEFTLNEPGNPSNREYSVEVLSDPPPFGSSTRVSELVVDFEWTGTDGGPYVNENMVDVAIESTANHGDVTGEVYYWGPDNSNNLTWMPLRTFSCEDSDILDHYYAFHAPQSPGDGLYRSRERFVDRPIHIFYESLKYKSRLKLVHSRDGTFTSRYDLVQLMPVGSLCDDDHERGPSRPRSDADRNGIIEPADFDAFAERWFSESASADLNLNGELDEGDIQTFEDAYVTGT